MNPTQYRSPMDEWKGLKADYDAANGAGAWQSLLNSQSSGKHMLVFEELAYLRTWAKSTGSRPASTSTATSTTTGLTGFARAVAATEAELKKPAGTANKPAAEQEIFGGISKVAASIQKTLTP